MESSFEFAKNTVFKNEKIRPILETMNTETRDAFFLHFYNYPKSFSFTRVVDNAKIETTVKKFISHLPRNKDGERRLVELFLNWKQCFDRFEKKVINMLSDNNPGKTEYLFLRSSTFLNNRESWERAGIDNSEGYEILKSEDEILEVYADYLDRYIHANALGIYYVINNLHSSMILANKFTHQLYDLRKTMEVSGFAGGQGISLIPLMIKYEDVYETPIEEHEIWDEKF